MGLLAVERDDLLPDVVRGAVPGAMPAEGRRRREAVAEKAARVEAAQGAMPPPDSIFTATARGSRRREPALGASNPPPSGGAGLALVPGGRSR